VGVEGSHRGLTLAASVMLDHGGEDAGQRLCRQADLTVVIVSFNDGHWLTRCLRSLGDHAGAVDLDIVIVDNGTDRTYEMVCRDFPQIRAIKTQNRGFANGNNVAVLTGIGRYVLFLNPDTEILDGSLADLTAALDLRPEVGLIGVKQVTGDGTLWPTIRYFPNFARALGEALGLERWPRRPRWAGERELDLSIYEREVACDWTSGSFLLARREALLSAGLFDERFFLYCEEPDLCLRMTRSGWSVRHLPTMTILHHAGKQGIKPELTAQEAFARRQYARKHFATPHRFAYIAAVAAGHLLRAGFISSGRHRDRHESARRALRTLTGQIPPPYGRPPRTALVRSTPGAP
jgi:GT2 family glycosyltransferase